MTMLQEMVMIGVIIVMTMATRFLPFLIFTSDKPVPAYIEDLGRVLPPAVFGFLVIYCLRDVSFLSGDHGVPELLALVLIAIIHFWKKNMLVSIASGTIFYMALVQFVV